MKNLMPLACQDTTLVSPPTTPVPSPTLEGRTSRMRLSPLVTRILIALLILRVLAVPVAARPDSSPSPSAHRFIVRICAWPAQRPPRPNDVAILLLGCRGPVPGPRPFAFWAASLADPDRPPLSRLASSSVRQSTANRIIDGPRC